MRQRIILLFVLVSLTLFADDFTLNLVFKPAFMEKVEMRLQSNGQESLLAFKNAYFDEVYSLKAESLYELDEFLKSFDFSHTNNVSSHISVKDGDTTEMTILGFDGITVSGDLLLSGQFESFSFWSPHPQTQNYELIRNVFSVVDDCSLEAKELRYFNALKGYFPKMNSHLSDDSSHIEFKINQDCYMVVEKMPQYIGGVDSLNAYIIRSCNRLHIQKLEIPGKVYVEFIVNENGSVSNVRILKGLSPEIDSVCVDIVSKMPDWIPGEESGEKVKVSYRLPFVFD